MPDNLALQDPRNPNNRQKLLRYNTKMEQEHGPNWRRSVEEEDEELGQEGAAEKVSPHLDLSSCGSWYLDTTAKQSYPENT